MNERHEAFSSYLHFRTMFRVLKSASLRDVFFSLKLGGRVSVSEDSSISNRSNTVSFGKVHVQHVHETDQVNWLLTCSVDDYELNKLHQARERRKAAMEVHRGTLIATEQVPEWSQVEAYKFMAQTNSLVFEEKRRKRMEQRRNNNNNNSGKKESSFFWFRGLQ